MDSYSGACTTDLTDRGGLHHDDLNGAPFSNEVSLTLGR